MIQRQYASPIAFKQAIEQRLRGATTSGAELGRRRQLLVFDRLLARIVEVFGDAVMLKGGLVLELRLERARATKDIDLRLVGSPNRVLEQLQTAARLELGDFLTFEIGPDPHHPEIQNEGVQYDGMRFRAECQLAGKIFGQPFGVDVAFGDPVQGEPQSVEAKDTLDFIGVKPPRLRLYPIETHIAEKLHAYTLPRSRPNSRVKDLPDLALLASIGPLEASKLRAAFEKTFTFRKTHPLPTELPLPNEAWAAPYARMAQADQLSWKTLSDVTRAAKAFLDPVLAIRSIVRWLPDTWTWRTS